MKHPMFGKALVVCAALSLPALAAAPAAGPAVATTKSARVIVKFKSDGALMREGALAARGGELPRVQHAARLSQRLGMAMRDGNAVAPRTPVSSTATTIAGDPSVRSQACSALIDDTAPVPVGRRYHWPTVGVIVGCAPL